MTLERRLSKLEASPPSLITREPAAHIVIGSWMANAARDNVVAAAPTANVRLGTFRTCRDSLTMSVHRGHWWVSSPNLRGKNGDRT
jgi:hypothetical protein